MENKFMELAYREAIKAKERDEVPIGCVIVKNNKVIAKAYNLKEKSQETCSHAEILAIKKANKKLGSWRLDGCDIYVSLEPCLMCAGAIYQARISRIFYGAKDPKAGAFGGLININEMKTLNHFPKVETGLIDEKYSLIIKDFFREKRRK